MQAFGLRIDLDKEQLPREVWHAQVVVFDMQTLGSSKRVFVRAKKSRLINTFVEVLGIFKRQWLGSSHAARLFGKVDFLNTTTFGRVGRTGTLPLKQRQYQQSGKLHSGLVFCLTWIIEILCTAPARELKIKPRENDTVLLYTDGSSDPKRTPFHYMGAVLWGPRAQKLFYTHCAVPQNIVDSWLPARQHIHLVEHFAGPVALDRWSDMLADREVIHFVDNSAALGALVKGYSSVEDCVKIRMRLLASCFVAQIKCLH